MSADGKCGLLPLMLVLGWGGAGQTAESPLFVPVDLAGRYNSTGFGKQGLTSHNLPTGLAKVDGIPFLLSAANNVDLTGFGWKYAKEDRTEVYDRYYEPAEIEKDTQRLVLRIPRAQYSRLWVLAAAEDDPAKSRVFSVRVTHYRRGGVGGVITATNVTVPAWNETGGAASLPIEVEKAKGHLFLVKVNLPLGEIADLVGDEKLAYLDLDINKELKGGVSSPDPACRHLRPLGKPSGVHLFGLTLQKSPVQMKAWSDETGNVFSAETPPRFHVDLSNISGEPQTFVLECLAEDWQGGKSGKESNLSLKVGEARRLEIDLPQSKRGWFKLLFRLRHEQEIFWEYPTTMAILPRNTRRATLEDSMFGTWCWHRRHFGARLDEAAPLYRKLGIFKGHLSAAKPEEQDKVGIRECMISLVEGHPKPPLPSADEIRLKVKQAVAAHPGIRLVKILHESYLSNKHMQRYPNFLLGLPPYQLDEEEEKKFRNVWDWALEFSKAVREVFPEGKICFGNSGSSVFVIEEFLRRGYPKELIDCFSNETGHFTTMPEAQPRYGVLHTLWWLKELRKHYGCEDKGLSVCYEWSYRPSGRQFLSERQQADYYVRDCLLALSYGVPQVNPAAIDDAGSSYYYLSYGSTGLCHRAPGLNPKPSFVTFATLTLMLDRAKYVGHLPMNSPSLHGLIFEKDSKEKVYALWAVRGPRAVTLGLSRDAEATLTDGMGNPTPLKGKKLNVTLSESPVYLTGVSEVTEVAPEGLPDRVEAADEGHLIDSFESLDDWRIRDEPREDLETNNFDIPRRKGDFTVALDKAKGVRGHSFKVTLSDRQQGPEVCPYYVVLEKARKVELPGQPRRISLWVYGNSSWGEVIFKLRDAKGESWTSIGPRAWNTGDARGDAAIAFDGWRRIVLDLPGQFEHENYPWPTRYVWKSDRNGIVDWPLTFEELIITLRKAVVYVNDMIPVPKRTIYLDELRVH